MKKMILACTLSFTVLLLCACTALPATGPDATDPGSTDAVSVPDPTVTPDPTATPAPTAMATATPIATVAATPTASPSAAPTVTPKSTKNTKNAASPDTTLVDGWHNVFFGTLGGRDICMDIHRSGKTLVAYYMYRDSDDEIMMEGSIDGVEIALESPRTQNRITGTFTQKNEFSGEFVSDEGSQSVEMRLNHAVVSKKNVRYIGCNNLEVEGFTRELKRMFGANDVKAVADRIDYPIRAVVDGKEITIKSSGAFIENADAILTKPFLKAMGNAYTRFMFSVDEGILFGEPENNVWIGKDEDGKLRIIGINHAE